MSEELKRTPDTTPQDVRAEQFPHSYIGRRTFFEWQEHAKRDDCLDEMVPGDLREILEFGRKMQACAEYWRDSISEDKRESNKLRIDLQAASAETQRLKRQVDVLREGLNYYPEYSRVSLWGRS